MNQFYEYEFYNKMISDSFDFLDQAITEYCEDPVTLENFKERLSHVCLNEIDDYHRTPLMYACRGKNLELVKYMIDSGADVNVGADSLERNDALSYAIASRSLPIVEHLIANGARITPWHFVTCINALTDDKQRRCLSMLNRYTPNQPDDNVALSLVFLEREMNDDLNYFLKNLSDEAQKQLIQNIPRLVPYSSKVNTNLNVSCIILALPMVLNFIKYALQLSAEKSNFIEKAPLNPLNSSLNVLGMLLALPMVLNFIKYALQLSAEKFNFIEKSPRNPLMFFCFGEKQRMEMQLARLKLTR